jgi:hypothetical protein
MSVPAFRSAGTIPREVEDIAELILETMHLWEESRTLRSESPDTKLEEKWQ